MSALGASAVAVALGGLAVASAAHAQTQAMNAQKPASKPGMGLSLKTVGALSCDAELAEETSGLGMYQMSCTYSETNRGQQDVLVGAELVGTNKLFGGALSSTVKLDVLSPSTTIDAIEMNGDYDRDTNRNFGLPEGENRLLFGGTNDLVVLRPADDLASALTPSARMTLTVQAPLGLRETRK
ncbi:MAG: hypothetical protein AAFR23_04510 [Pseudomonadota bacterium]